MREPAWKALESSEDFQDWLIMEWYIFMSMNKQGEASIDLIHELCVGAGSEAKLFMLKKSSAPLTLSLN